MEIHGLNKRSLGIAARVLLFCCAVLGSSGKGEFEKIFIIGDSFVDTGNRDPNNNTRTPIGRVNQDWEPPYGRTRPAVPDGRFSDGKVLSDFLADFMGLQPRPYRLLNRPANSTRLEDGINFAVAGCGVFDNLGFTKTGDQIRQLTAVLKTDLYPNDDLFSKALILYAISGNDYAAYRRNNGSTDILSIIKFVKAVVTQLTEDVTNLYNLGFRTFAIGKLAPVGCLPYSAVAKNYSACDETYNAIATLHNLNLMWLVAAFPRAKIIFLDNQLAFATVAYNLSNRYRLMPCCSGLEPGTLCGDVDRQGKPLSRVCTANSMKKYFWWDEFHPTEVGWKYIFHLFLQGFPHLYTNGKSLTEFLGIDSDGRVH